MKIKILFWYNFTYPNAHFNCRIPAFQYSFCYSSSEETRLYIYARNHCSEGLADKESYFVCIQPPIVSGLLCIHNSLHVLWSVFWKKEEEWEKNILEKLVYFYNGRSYEFCSKHNLHTVLIRIRSSLVCATLFAHIACLHAECIITNDIYPKLSI